MSTGPIEGDFRKAFQDFSGGLNTSDSSVIVKQNQFTQLDNALVNSRGVLEKAKGYSIDGSPFPDDVDSFIRMLVNYKRGTSVDKLVCAALDEGNTNATYKVDFKETSGDGTYAYIGHTTGTASFTSANTAVVGVGTAWSSHLKAGDKIKASAHADATYTEIASVTNDTNLVLVAGGYLGATSAGATYKARKINNKDFIPTSVVFNNNLIITNGSDSILTYNNTTLNTITDTDAPKGKFIEAHKSRVFIAGTSGGPSSIFWSAINDETSWDAAALEIVFANDNGNICAIKSFADSLIVLKDNGKIYQVIGSFDQDAVGEPDFIRRIDTPSNIGTIAGFTVVVHDNNKLHFLTETGVYSLDARMNLEKTSWDIDSTVQDITLQSGAVAAKSYVYDTKTQWDTGTLTGMRSTTAGDIGNYFDLLTITDFDKTLTNAASVWIDSSLNIHVAYINTSHYIVYTKWLASDNTSTSTNIVTSGTPYTVSLAIAANGNIGVAYSIPAIAAVQNAEIWFVEQVSSVWSTPIFINTGADAGSAISIAYNSTSVPYVIHQSGSQFLITSKYTGSWAGVTVDTGHFYQSFSLRFNATDQLRFAALRSHGSAVSSTRSLKYGTATGTGSDAAYTDTVSFTATPSAADYLQMELGSAYTGYSMFYCTNEGSGSRLRNIGTTTTSVIDAAAKTLNGATLDAANLVCMAEVIGTAPTQQEKHMYETSLNMTNATVNTAEIGNRVSDRGMHRNGSTYASVTPGTNANELLVRRIAYRATYSTPITSDSSLSAWGTYEVTDEVTNGNTVTHTVGLGTTSTLAAAVAITNGSVISTDSTMIFVQANVTSLMTVFAAPSISALTLNYTGTGIGASLPTATVFNNEIYIALGMSGDSANTEVLLFDRNSTWSETYYPVIFMARYRGSLYGGASATGKIFKLIQGYRFGTSTAYTLTATSKEDLLGSLELQKKIFKVYVLYEIQPTGTFNFAYRTDNFATSGGSSWVTTSVDQTSGSSTPGFAEVPFINGLCRSIQFKVTSTAIDEQLGIIGWVILYNYANPR